MPDYGDISKFQMDVLLKIGTEGAKNGAEALSGLMEKKIGMSVPSLRLLLFSDVPDVMGGAETLVAGIFLTTEGPAPCNVLLIFPMKSAKIMAGTLVECTYSDNEIIDDMGKSALCEAGNVVSGAYLLALSNATNMDFIPSVPALAIDMAGAILDTVLAQSGMNGDHALFMETLFTEIEEEVTGHFFLLPEAGSLEKIMEAIGVKG